MTPRRILAEDGRLIEGSTRPAPTAWATMDDRTYAPATVLLADWVDWLLVTFSIDRRTIPFCWADHPAIVTELGALHDAWLAAYHPTSDASRPAAWLDDLPPRLQRIRDRSTACQGH